MGCGPWGHWGSDTTEWLHFHFSLSCIGEGNGTPLQCSCLENPRDGGAWWAAVYGVAQSRTRLKWLSKVLFACISSLCPCYDFMRYLWLSSAWGNQSSEICSKYLGFQWQNWDPQQPSTALPEGSMGDLFFHMVPCIGLIPGNSCRMGRETCDGWIDGGTGRETQGYMKRWRVGSIPQFNHFAPPPCLSPESLLRDTFLNLHYHWQAWPSGPFCIPWLSLK